MPVIVYKTMTLNAVWVQVRRIACEHCRELYHYLATGNQTIQTTGLPLVSSSEGMRKQVGEQLEKALKKIGARSRLGEAFCPHCLCYQPWMISKSRVSNIGGGLAIGGAIGVGFFADIYMDQRHDHAFYMWWLLAIVGAAIGIAIGAARALKPGKRVGMVDRRSMKPEEHEGFLAMCKKKDYHPALAWYGSIGGKFLPKVPVVPLPPKDDIA